MDNHERAVKASNERWHPTIIKATHTGILQIGHFYFECDVLEDKTRIIRENDLLKAMGKGRLGGWYQKRGDDDKTPGFVKANNLTPYLEDDFLVRGAPIIYKSKEGRKLIGYDATILPDACKIYDQAFRDGVLQHGQLKIAENCKILIYALAKTGITALIDEVTGYQSVRERDELQKLMNRWIIPEGRAWTKRFPNSFFAQVYKLYGWEYPKANGKNHPQCIGKFINKYIYGKMPKELLGELERLNPQNENGNRKMKHQQLFTEDVGHPGLQRQIERSIDIMKISENSEQFKNFMEKL